MAQVLTTVEFDIDEDKIGDVLDKLAGIIQEETGFAPLFGLQVDGEHRDPDDPLTDLFS